MSNKWNKQDITILIISSFVFFFFLYLLYSDLNLLLSQEEISTSPSIGDLKEIRNDVRFKSNRRFTWNAAMKNIELHENDSVFTGENSYAMINLKSGIEIEISENSMVSFNKELEQKLLNLNFGTMTANLNDNSKFNFTVNGKPVKIEGSNAKVKLSNQGENDYKLELISGEINVEKNGHSIKINKENSDILAKTLAATKPSPIPTLPPPPEIANPVANTDFIFNLNEDKELVEPNQIEISWTYYSNIKTEFQVQISSDVNFETIVSEINTTNLKILSVPLKEGQYFVKVKDSKTQSDRSIWSEPIPFVVGFGKPPILQKPVLIKTDIKYHDPSPDPLIVQWKPVKNAKKYKFEISRDETFQKVTSFEKETPQIILKNYTSTGPYFYRVTALSPKGTESPLSDTGFLYISTDKPILKSIPSREVFGSHPDDQGPPQEIPLKWTENRMADKYEIQLSSDNNFLNPQVNVSTSANTHLTIEKPGKYHIRVRPLSKENLPLTEFSNSEEFIYTLKKPLHLPVLTEPGNQMTLFSQKEGFTPFWLEWKTVPEATQYVVELSKDPLFKTKILSKISFQTRLLIKSPLGPGDIYWRVKAENSINHSHWSMSFSFNLQSGRMSTQSKKEE